MSHQHPYIVQYVGFQTGMDEETFLNSWSPFATSFKSAGIERIDIYTIKNKDVLTYISRNVWPAEAYLKNFPSGVPGAARTQDVVVLQFGGYWLPETQKEQAESMLLLFQREAKAVTEKERFISARVTDSVPFQQLVEVTQLEKDYTSTNDQFAFHCDHLKSL